MDTIDATDAMDAGDAAAADGMFGDVRSADGGDDGSRTDGADGASSDGGETSSACTGDLSNILGGDFTITFTLKTTQADQVIALLSQRLLCTNGTFWDVRLVNSHIYFEIDDPLGLVFVMSQGGSVNDGLPHAIVVRRRAGTVQITVDDVVSGMMSAMQSLTQLPMLEVGTSPCEGLTQTVALQGDAVTNICVARE